VALLLLIFAVPAMADTSTTTFEGFTPGSVDGQGGWTATGPYDQEVVAPAGHPAGFGERSLRVSSLRASGSFGDWVFSDPVQQPAGERLANKGFNSEFSFLALGEQVNGSHISISPDNGQGGRMSYVRLEDTPDGVRVFFVDVPNRDGAAFNEVWIATLDRDVPHTIKFAMSLVPGEANDVVKVYVDGVQKACGTSWENYYRYTEHSPVPVVDRLIIQARGDSTDFGAAPSDARGFLFDNVRSISSATGAPAGCDLPTGPAGPTGATGPAGAAGAVGAAGATMTGVAGDSLVAPKLIGNTLRVIHAPQRKGQRFLSARATLRNNRLPVHGRSITVDLRGRVVGNYNVIVVARYKTRSGKVHAYRTLRNLSVTRALSEAGTTA
jgi:hypothetical protein